MTTAATTAPTATFKDKVIATINEEIEEIVKERNTLEEHIDSLKDERVQMDRHQNSLETILAKVTEIDMRKTKPKPAPETDDGKNPSDQKEA